MDLKPNSLAAAAATYTAILLTVPPPAAGQLVFTSGSDTNQLLFERVGGTSVPVETGAGTHDWPGLSRDGRFVTFSVPDPVAGNGLNPSADLFLFDRAARTTRRIADHTTSISTRSLALSSQVAPGGQFVAYGVAIGPAFGALEGSASNELNIADVGTGVIVSNPTFARGATSDAFAAEFKGFSFFPGSLSFVTPLYRFTGISDPAPVELPAIVRFDHNPATGQWDLAAQLSTPQWQSTPDFGGLGRAASVHTFPAISPSGSGLAYFSVLVPDARTGTRPWVSRVVISNSDGTNARLLTTFAEGFLPTGLTWTADGSAIVVSISQQVNVGTGFVPLPVRSNSATFSVATSDGTTSQISEIGSSLAPMLPAVTNSGVDLSQVSPQLTRRTNGRFRITAPGLPAGQTFRIQASNGSLNGFTQVAQATGAELATGFNLPDSTANARFFRIAE